jgi:hypothetical protein
MAKAKATTENGNGKEKAKSGTSLPARAKSLVLALAVTLAGLKADLESAGIVIPEFSEVETLSDLFLENTSKGLPLKVQLEKATQKMREILTGADTSTGVVVFTDEQEEQYNALAAKVQRIKAAIKKENNKPAE